MIADKEVITFFEPGAADAIQRFIAWSGEDTVYDMGLIDGHLHRYRVDAALWRSYVRERTAR